MEMTKREVEAIAAAVNQAQPVQLNDLQLALVGGGIGEVVFG
jgi:hypothetical protein